MAPLPASPFDTNTRKFMAAASHRSQSAQHYQYESALLEFLFANNAKPGMATALTQRHLLLLADSVTANYATRFLTRNDDATFITHVQLILYPTRARAIGATTATVSAFVTFHFIANPNSRLPDRIPAFSIMRSSTSTAPSPFYPTAHFSGETHEFTAESNKHKH
jgi:hypothetical protein